MVPSMLIADPSQNAWKDALVCGDRAPNVTLTDLGKRPVSLGDLWARGPLVLILDPFPECEYGHRELGKWASVKADLLALGATVAIASLQGSDNSLPLAARDTGMFIGLLDVEMRAAFGFGVAVPMAADVAHFYVSIGIDPQDLKRSGQALFSTAATYIVDRGGRIVFAHFSADGDGLAASDLITIVRTFVS